MTTQVEHCQPYGLPVTIITPPREAGEFPTLLATLGAFAVARDAELDRYVALAERQARTVVIVDTPGWEPERAGLSPATRRDLVAGSCRGAAAQMLRSVRAGVPGIHDAPISLVGYSLGASTAAAIGVLLTQQRHRPAYLTLVEPVAVAVTSPLTLLRRNLWEANHAPVRRSEPSKEWPSPFGVHTLDMALLLWSLTRAGLRSDLAILADAGVPISLLRGKDSRLCPADGFADVSLTTARSTRLRARTVQGQSHSLWHDPRVVADLATLVG